MVSQHLLHALVSFDVSWRLNQMLRLPSATLNTSRNM